MKNQHPSLIPDLVVAEAFLNALDPKGRFTFQTLDDKKERKDRSLAKVFHGTLSEHAEKLAALQQRGAAILPDGAERGILHPCLLRIQPDTQRLRTAFLRTLIQDSDLLRPQLSYQSNATTIEVIYSYTIASVVIPVPPVAEQDAIMRFLSDELTRFNALTAEARRAVDLLQERRTALISAAVTGQIDVRGLAGGANTPDFIAASAYAVSAGG